MAEDHPGISLPQDWELIAFFEAEPTLLDDPGYGWQYNTITFETQRGDDRITCVLTPSYGKMEVQWRRGDKELIDLKLRFAERLMISSEYGAETMKVEFDPSKYLDPFLLQLKPSVRIKWGLKPWLK